MTNGMTMWYDVNSFDATRNVWADKSIQGTVVS